MKKPICKECQSQGLKYRVNEPMYSVTTCMSYNTGYWDEDGNYVQNKDPNTKTYTYECSNGHYWTQTTGEF